MPISQCGFENIKAQKYPIINLTSLINIVFKTVNVTPGFKLCCETDFYTSRQRCKYYHTYTQNEREMNNTAHTSSLNYFRFYSVERVKVGLPQVYLINEYMCHASPLNDHTLSEPTNINLIRVTLKVY